MRPGGHFFIVDNAFTSGRFAGFLSRFAYSRGKAAQMQQENDAFYSGLGFGCATVESTWTAPSRAALQRVTLMEFPAEAVDTLMSEVEAAELSYHYRVYHRQK